MFAWLSVFDAVIGQRSIIDLPEGLEFDSVTSVEQFLKSYGFDPTQEPDQHMILWFYRRSWNYLKEVLSFDPSPWLPEASQVNFPTWLNEVLVKPFSRSGLNLLKHEKPHQWRQHRQAACAILRVMHAFVHAQTDLLGYFPEKVLKYTLDPFYRHIHHDGASGKPYFEGMLNGHPFRLPLELVETKPHKTSVSTVTKLLAKAETHMIHIYDRVGIRFVVADVLQALILIEMLLENHVLNPAHIMASQTTNETYPVEILRQFVQENAHLPPIHKWTDSDFQLWNQKLKEFLSIRESEAQWITKPNPYSAGRHRFIKFVGRQLIPLGQWENQNVKIFYPFEVQILTWEQFLESQAPDVQHEAYKKRQLDQAKSRVLPSGD